MFQEGEFFTDNLLVRIHFINKMSWWTGLAPWEFEFYLPGSLSTFLLFNTAHCSSPARQTPDPVLDTPLVCRTHLVV